MPQTTKDAKREKKKGEKGVPEGEGDVGRRWGGERDKKRGRRQPRRKERQRRRKRARGG